MALTGIQIFKLLPQTNCKECGVPTCLAFAMNLASGKAELDKCPYVSDEAREKLAEASAPPILPVEIGKGVRKTTVGGETVLYRHEKTFYNQTAFAACVGSDIAEADLDAKLKVWNAIQYERVGYNLRPELVAVKDVNGNADAFATTAKKIAETSEFNVVLMTDNADVMKAGVTACGFKRPLMYAATAENIDAYGAIAKENDLPIVVKADSVEALQPLTDKLVEMGHKKIVLDSGAREVKAALHDQIAMRRSALKDGNRKLGFPTITFPCEMASNLEMETLVASMFVAKYGSIVVMSDFTGDTMFPLLLERLNIFTDPQRPMTVTEGIYPINNPDANSPVLVTTNFALTYFIVAGEAEGSKAPTWLLIKDAEGLSVLTAWAAGKFAGDDVGMFVKKCGIGAKVDHTELIIPGYAAAIAGEVEEELPGWTITVGPREAAHLPAFLKAKVAEGCATGGTQFKDVVPTVQETKKEEPKEEVKVEVVGEVKPEAAPEREILCNMLRPLKGSEFWVIGESLNVIGKKIGKAFKERDPKPIQEEALMQKEKGVDFIDINLGPAKKDGHELMPWVVETIQEVVDDIPLALDTSNIDAIEAALPVCKLPPLINSIMVRPARYKKMIPMAAKYNAEFVALMWGPEGLPRDENERAALLTELMHEANEAGIPNEKMWVDGIVTPVNIQQPQAIALMNFMDMLPAITPGCMSTCGVSNISSGVPDHLRHVLNITFTVMLQIHGMKSFIADAKDDITMDLAYGRRPDIVDAIRATMEGNAPDLAGLAQDIQHYVKSTKVILGETLFSDSWLDL